MKKGFEVSTCLSRYFPKKAHPVIRIAISMAKEEYFINLLKLLSGFFNDYSVLIFPPMLQLPEKTAPTSIESFPVKISP